MTSGNERSVSSLIAVQRPAMPERTAHSIHGPFWLASRSPVGLRSFAGPCTIDVLWLGLQHVKLDYANRKYNVGRQPNRHYNTGHDPNRHAD